MIASTTTVNIDFTAMMIAIAPILAVAANYFFSKRQRLAIAKEGRKALEENTKTTKEVHSLVNSQRDEMLKQIADLQDQVKRLIENGNGEGKNV